MELNKAFGTALKHARQMAGLTQEDFTSISSRTYMSSLERGNQSPTIEKLDQLSEVIGLHPVTLLAVTYMTKDQTGGSELLRLLQMELTALGLNASWNAEA